MAKKNSKSNEITGKKFDFLAFDKALSKIDGFETGSIIEENTFSEVDHYIHTGCYLLNAQISGSLFGGIPNSRSVGLVGDPETGKTFLCLNIAREAQRQMDYDIVYCETEAAVDRSAVAKLGIDTRRFRYQPITTINEMKHFTVTLIDMVKKERAKGNDPRIMLFLDSLGMLSTTKELNDALEGKEASDMGLKAKQLRSLFRSITMSLAAAKIPFIVTNHTTIGGIGSYAGPTKESSGGDGPIFSLSAALMLSKVFDIDDKEKNAGGDKKRNGIIINSRPKKSRSTIHQNIKVHVGFAGGMNPFVDLEAYCSWDACGIGRGKVYTAKEFEKEFKGKTADEVNGRPFVFEWEEEVVDKKTGEVTKVTKMEDKVYVPSETGRWCVKHFGKSVAKASELWNSKVFTETVLRQLDDNVIKETFKLPDWVDPEDVSSFATDEEIPED